MKKLITSTLAAVAIFSANYTHAHCQIPCGIYGDEARITEMMEDVTTIRKSVNQINTLAEDAGKNANQLVRWVNNKETHADNISDIVLKYFLQQRIKADQDQYQEKLVALHKIVVLSMKAKQTSDVKVVDDLEAAIKAFHNMYHKH
ncbi:MAG: superoxide dismutase, Ni [Lentisphaeria bacterium]|nr:superoxide dismutase, Ni [Lentisphaeria bacterium]